MRKVIVPWTGIWLLAFAPVAAIGVAPLKQPASVSGVPWPATDGLGRSLPVGPEVGPHRTDRFVGMFYFLWHRDGGRRPQRDAPYDITRIIAADPDALRKPDSTLWGPQGEAHYWGEPLYGYYSSNDPWVLRRHAQLLADAGVDTLIFDTTNAVTYHETYLKLCEVFAQVRSEGRPTPQVAFMVNTQAGETAAKIYEEFYKPGLHSELWFRWEGKPLLICDLAQASPELREFFTLRRAHWPFTMVDTPHAWHWEATYPQPYGYTDDPRRPEQVSVSAAQNLAADDGRVVNMSSGNARGRSFHAGVVDRTPGAVDHGHNFQEQWTRALALDPPFVMVTGWNEWTAGRFTRPGEPVAFVDQFDQEFSRDIEPMKGGHGDNYYYQLVANVRRYKGSPPPPKASAEKTIRIEGGFDQWGDVGPEYFDHLGETIARAHPGAAGLFYTNRTGRNDFAAAKVARDAQNFYFYVRTREPLSPASDPNWMWLLIDGDRNAKTGWEGYDLIVNRTAEGGAGWLERNEGGWKWTRVTTVARRVEGCDMHLAVPRAALDMPANRPVSPLRFKWADNIQHPGEVMDFYLSGDVAPGGRFVYHYGAE